MNKLLEQSKEMKKEADNILEESGIMDILAEYGEVHIGGSYALDTMLRPDIDLYVVAKKHDWEKVLDIQQKIMRTKYFREFDFLNWVDFPAPETMPIRGYYFQPWVPKGETLWKMDIWLFEEPDYKPEKRNHFKALLDAEPDDAKRVAILEIKQAMRKGKKYEKGVDGNKIYKAVLEDGITTSEEFKEYIKHDNQ